MKTRIIACFILLAMLFSTSALASSLTWNELNGEEYGATVAAHVFADTLTELSGGSLTIDLYINGDMGSEAESMQGLQWGTLDIFRGNASSLPNYGAELIGATGLPYVFTDMAQFEEVAESEFGQELLDSVEQADCGYIALAWLVEGPRSLFVTEKAWRKMGSPQSVTLDIMQGLNIRVPDTDLMRGTMQALGAIATPITYSELYKSLRADSIDGAENGVTSYMSANFNEVAPYFITDAHTFGCGVILVSRLTWDGLTPQEQAWMRQAGQAASEACYTYNSTQEQACFDSFAEKGVTLLPVEDIEAWQEACQGLYSEQSEEVQAIVARIQRHEY